MRRAGWVVVLVLGCEASDKASETSSKLTAAAATPQPIAAPQPAALPKPVATPQLVGEPQPVETIDQQPPWPLPTMPKWDTVVQTDRMDDQQIVGIKRASEEFVTTTFGKRVLPKIWIVCNKTKTDVRIDLGSILDTEVRSWESSDAYGYTSGTPLRLRFDQDKPVSHFGLTSTDGTSAFLKNPIPIVKKMIGKKTLLVEYRPMRSGPQTVSFALDGLDEALTEVRKACHW